jgi:hypothetical protein
VELALGIWRVSRFERTNRGQGEPSQSPGNEGGGGSLPAADEKIASAEIYRIVRLICPAQSQAPRIFTRSTRNLTPAP